MVYRVARQGRRQRTGRQLWLAPAPVTAPIATASAAAVGAFVWNEALEHGGLALR